MANERPVPTPKELQIMGCPPDKAQEVSDRIASMPSDERPVTLEDVQKEVGRA